MYVRNERGKVMPRPKIEGLKAASFKLDGEKLARLSAAARDQGLTATAVVNAGIDAFLSGAMKVEPTPKKRPSTANERMEARIAAAVAKGVAEALAERDRQDAKAKSPLPK
jgi:hypothetical protein